MAERSSPPTSQNPVVNQPPPFEDVNLFASDRALREAAPREGGALYESQIDSFGASMRRFGACLAGSPFGAACARFHIGRLLRRASGRRRSCLSRTCYESR